MKAKAFDTTPEQLAKYIGCHIDTAKRFLDRSEFAHIEKEYIKIGNKGRRVLYHNVFHSDIAKLKELYHPKAKEG